MKIYLASYLPCIYEGNYGTISVHKTKKGAEIAVGFHKEKCRKEYYDLWKNDEPPIEFGAHEAWNIFEDKLKE